MHSYRFLRVILLFNGFSSIILRRKNLIDCVGTVANCVVSLMGNGLSDSTP